MGDFVNPLIKGLFKEFRESYDPAPLACATPSLNHYRNEYS
jgi:hypothetical protein